MGIIDVTLISFAAVVALLSAPTAICLIKTAFSGGSLKNAPCVRQRS